MKWVVVAVLIGACISNSCYGQRIPPPPQSFLNNPNNQQQQIPQQQLQPQQQQPQQQQNGTGGGAMNSQQQKTDELANIKDENIKRVLLELSTLQTPSQRTETMARVAKLVGPLFIANFDQRGDQISTQSRDPSSFPQRILSAVTDIQGEEVKAVVLQKNLDLLHAGDFAFLPLAIQYGFQEEVLKNVSGTKLASLVKANPGDTVVAFKVSSALVNKPDQQLEFLQALGSKLLPEVQRIIMRRLLEWWGDPHGWKDRELNLLTSAGSPLLAYMPPSQLQILDDELADRFVTVLGQSQDIARGWWRKSMSLKRSWFDLAKGARYFGAVHEWSFRRMQKLSFLLEGAAPEDLELVPPVPEIKSLVIGNHYTELQARVVFNAFYPSPPLSQEDLQEFQFHVLDLIPAQLQRFDFADSFGTLDEMLSILERQPDPSYPTILQISYFMWPIVNSTNAVMNIAPPDVWQQRELSQVGRMFFLLPKSVVLKIKPNNFNWDSNVLSSIRSNHLTKFQIWKLADQILSTVDDRFKHDYIFMIPAPFQRGIPTQNISQALLAQINVKPEILRALIEETSGMLTSQKAVILQRTSQRLGEPIIIRTFINTKDPSDMFELISPKILFKNMATIVKTIVDMPETGRFGLTSIQTKLLPRELLSLWLKWVRENSQVSTWTSEDLLGRSSVGMTNELNLAILGLSCRDIEMVDPWDILPIFMHYRHELYILRKFKPSLTFNVNLRSCVLTKFIEYLKQKSFLSGNQTNGQILAGLTEGEIGAIGGEILSTIPTQVLDQLDMDTRDNIIKEIGKLETQELFSLVSLENLHWYAKAIFRDTGTGASDTGSAETVQQRKRRQSESQTSDANAPASNNSTRNDTSGQATTTGETPADIKTGDTGFNTSSNGTNLPGDGPDTREVDPPTNTSSSSPTPSASFRHGINLQSLNGMGNLLCYADDIFDAPNWQRSLLKDVLDTKTSVGEKTCCLTKALRDKWFQTIKAVYGSDTSSWNEFDLTAIGDLLIVLPDEDLQRIPTDSLGKAITPIMRQTAFNLKISIPGEIKRISLVSACANELGGNEGLEFMAQYKKLMKRFFQASQWMVNTVKSTKELIRDGVGRTGRIPRWAEHILVKRQVPLSVVGGGELTYSGAPTYSPAPQIYAQPMYAPQPTQFYSPAVYAPQQMVAAPSYFAQPVSYSPQYMTPTYNPQVAYAPVYAQQPAPVYLTQPQPTTFTQQPAFMQPLQPTMDNTQSPVGGIASQPAFGGSGAAAGAGFGGAGAVAGGGNIGTGGVSGAAAGSGSFGSGIGAGSAAGAAGGSFGAGDASGAAAGSGTFGAGAGSFSGNSDQTGANVGGSLATRQLPPPQQQSQPPLQQQAQPPPLQQSQPPLQQQAQPPPLQQTQTTPQQQAQPPPLQQTQTPPQQQSQLPSQQQTQTPPQSLPQPLQQSQTPPQQQTQPPPQQQSQPAPPPPPLQQAQTPPQQQTQPPPPQQSPPPPLPQSQPPPPLQSQPPPQQPAENQQMNQQKLSQGNTGVPLQAAGLPLVMGRAGDGTSDPSRSGTGLERALNSGILQDDTHNSEITCHGIKAAGPTAIGLGIDDLNKLNEADLFDCVEALGKIEWDEQTKNQILTLLKSKLGFSKDSINAVNLIEMGDLVTAFTSDTPSQGSNGFGGNATNSNVTIHSDVSMIDLKVPQSFDVIALLGEQVTDPNLLKSLAEKFIQDNRIFPGFSDGMARPENLRIVVMSLRNIICGLSDKIVNSIFETDASLFIDTSRILGLVEGCSAEVLSTLAIHAVRPTNYGPPRLWTQEDLETIGVVFAGLKPEAISTISAEAMQGLTALAVKNLPLERLLAFTPEQLQKISFSAAKAMSDSHVTNLSPEASNAIRTVLEVQADLFSVPTTNTQSETDSQDTLATRDVQNDGGRGTVVGVGGRAKQDADSPTDTSSNGSSTTPETTTTPPPGSSTTETPLPASASTKITSSSLILYLLAFVVNYNVIKIKCL